MLCKVHRLFCRIAPLLALLLVKASAAAAAAETAAATDERPHFVLVEEHHHVVSHLVRFAREGVLHSHAVNPNEWTNPNGTILIHIDSHADMGMPRGLNYLPTGTIFSQTPSEGSKTDHELLLHSEINDFLPLLGYMGVVDHIVFVEPPWSNLVVDAQYITVGLTFAVLSVSTKAGEVMSVTYASIRNFSSENTFSQNVPNEATRVLTDMMVEEDEPCYVVPHERLHRECDKSPECKRRTIKLTVLPFQGAADQIQKIMDAPGNKDRDIVLDIDLDGFSTTSPGAISLHETVIPDYDMLDRIYHTVHDDFMCDMDIGFWERMKESAGGSKSNSDIKKELCQSQSKSFVHGSSFQPPNSGTIEVSERASNILASLVFYDKMDKAQDEVLAKIFEYYLPIIDISMSDELFVDIMDAFLIQPFYIGEPESIDAIIDFYFDHLFRNIFEKNDRPPKVINVVRSPFYTPDHRLDFIECKVFDQLLDMFGSDSSVPPTLYHSDEVKVDRTNCLGKIPTPNRFSIGSNPHIEVDQWRLTNTTFNSFYIGEDEDVDRDAMITVDFVNEHKDAISIRDQDGRDYFVNPGKRLTEEVTNMARWELSIKEKSGAPFKTVFFKGKNGYQQSYGSISGKIPVTYESRVEVEVENPLDSGIRVELRTAPEEDDPDDPETEDVVPGDMITLRTVHGKRWTLYDMTKPTHSPDHIIGEIIANATYEKTEKFVLFSGEGFGNSEL